MTSFVRPVYVRKARRPGGKRPLYNAQTNEFEAKLAVKTTSNVQAAIEGLQSLTSPAKIERLYRAGKIDQLAGQFAPGKVQDFFANVAPELAQAVQAGSDQAVKGLKGLRVGAANQAQLGITNDAIAEFVSTRTGNLIVGVTDDMQVVVQNAVRTGMAAGKNPQQIAADIYGGVGLDPTRANAVATYTGKDNAKFRDAMTLARAELIARTEVSFAVNHGQVATWQAAVDDGLLSPDSKKVWITDPTPCPKICEPMDGVEVALDEDFILPDGVEVIAPPAHPRCRCLVGILEVEGTKPTSGRERDDDEEGDAGDE